MASSKPLLGLYLGLLFLSTISALCDPNGPRVLAGNPKKFRLGNHDMNCPAGLLFSAMTCECSIFATDVNSISRINSGSVRTVEDFNRNNPVRLPPSAHLKTGFLPAESMDMPHEFKTIRAETEGAVLLSKILNTDRVHIVDSENPSTFFLSQNHFGLQPFILPASHSEITFPEQNSTTQQLPSSLTTTTPEPTTTTPEPTTTSTGPTTQPTTRSKPTTQQLSTTTKLTTKQSSPTTTTPEPTTQPPATTTDLTITQPTPTTTTPDPTTTQSQPTTTTPKPTIQPLLITTLADQTTTQPLTTTTTPKPTTQPLATRSSDPSPTHPLTIATSPDSITTQPPPTTTFQTSEQETITVETASLSDSISNIPYLSPEASTQHTIQKHQQNTPSATPAVIPRPGTNQNANPQTLRRTHTTQHIRQQQMPRTIQTNPLPNQRFTRPTHRLQSNPTNSFSNYHTFYNQQTQVNNHQLQRQHVKQQPGLIDQTQIKYRQLPRSHVRQQPVQGQRQNAFDFDPLIAWLFAS